MHSPWPLMRRFVVRAGFALAFASPGAAVAQASQSPPGIDRPATDGVASVGQPLAAVQPSGDGGDASAAPTFAFAWRDAVAAAATGGSPKSPVALPLVSARAIARSPQPVARDARFDEGSLAMPWSVRTWQNALRLEARTELMRPAPSRVGLAFAADAEYRGGPGLTLKARTQARPTADRVETAFGAVAELAAAPDIALTAATDVDASAVRHRIGVRYELVPRLIGIEVAGRRTPGPDGDAWGLEAALTLRAPLLR